MLKFYIIVYLHSGLFAAGDATIWWKRDLNVSAIIMFFILLLEHLGITKWAAKKQNLLSSDFYTAGGGITGFQNGMAIAGDYMSAASFLVFQEWFI